MFLCINLARKKKNLEMGPRGRAHVPAGPSGVQRKASNLLVFFPFRSIVNLPSFLYLKDSKNKMELMGKCLHREVNDGAL